MSENDCTMTYLSTDRYATVRLFLAGTLGAHLPPYLACDWLQEITAPIPAEIKADA